MRARRWVEDNIEACDGRNCDGRNGGLCIAAAVVGTPVEDATRSRGGNRLDEVPQWSWKVCRVRRESDLAECAQLCLGCHPETTWVAFPPMTVEVVHCYTLPQVHEQVIFDEVARTVTLRIQHVKSKSSLLLKREYQSEICRSVYSIPIHSVEEMIACALSGKSDVPLIFILL